MAVAYQIITPPAVEPISMTEAKLACRVDFDDEDLLIARYITAAREYAEVCTHRSLGVQTVRCINTIARPTGGELSGPIGKGPNWYQYQEQLGANPFGAAMFYFDIPLPPCLSISLIETRTTVWDPWLTFTGITTLDAVPEPARLYFQIPVTANQWRFTYQAGYDGVNFWLPTDLRLAMLELVAFWFDHREGDPIPEAITNKLLGRRVEWV